MRLDKILVEEGYSNRSDWWRNAVLNIKMIFKNKFISVNTKHYVLSWTQCITNLFFFFFFIISHWSYYMKFGVSNSMTNNVVLLWNMVLCSLADQHQCFRRIDWLEQRHHFLWNTDTICDATQHLVTTSMLLGREGQ